LQGILLMNRNLLFYLAVLALFGTGIYLTLRAGSELQQSSSPAETVYPAWGSSQTRETPQSEACPGSVPGTNLRDPLSILLLQVTTIILSARLIGHLFIKLGQPAVIGEMLAGILLGPSVLGWLFPEALSFLFPESSMAALRLLSQIGVVLFMFVVGMDFNVNHLREKAQAALIVSHASIIVPFFFGAVVALAIYRSFAPRHIPFSAFALFMGVAMSITAFPVLARIVQERNLAGTFLGTTAIACAAIDDLTAWCVLALVVAVVKTDGVATALRTVLLALLFSGTMLFLLRPQLSRLLSRRKDQQWNKGLIAGALAMAFASAWVTEAIGIHALFGAFLAGVVMPSYRFRSFLKERFDAFSSVSLLPLFFAFTGLRTRLSLLGDWESWATCFGVIAVAIAGKLGGSMLAARWAGMSWKDSFSIGALMNTRGLVELIVLNIGYDLGILSPRIFAILVLMSLVTTAMTGPLLSIASHLKSKEAVVAQRLGSA